MLSLGSITEKPTATPQGETRGKTRSTTDGQDRSDFQTYMLAAMQPAKPEPKVETPAIKTDSPTPEKTVEQMAQKAGHGDTTEIKGEAEKSTKPQPTVNAHDLMQTLGLKIRTSTAEPIAPLAAKSPKGESLETKSQRITKTTSRATEIKTAVATSTLKELDRLPDLILNNTDGLKKLSERLGLAFLSKMSEKLGEKQTKNQTTTTEIRHEAKIELALTQSTTKAQKAGDGGASSKNSDAEPRTPTKRANTSIVSRETTATLSPNLSATPGSPSGLQVGEASAKMESDKTQVRHADPIITNTTRANEHIARSVENPTLRSDMMRQFSEIMTRANVLVTDSQNAQFSVKLFPRELGRMEIDLKMVDGEIKGKIVVENEEVKSEMQNFLNQRDQSSSGESFDMNRIDIEVRQNNQNAQHNERTPDTEALLQNLVTRAATRAYESSDSGKNQGNALYA